MKTVAVLMILVLAGCAGTNQTRAKNSLAITCKTYAFALTELTALRKAGKLSTSQIDRVTSVNNSIKPICGRDSTFDPAIGVTAVETAIATLKGIKP